MNKAPSSPPPVLLKTHAAARFLRSNRPPARHLKTALRQKWLKAPMLQILPATAAGGCTRPPPPLRQPLQERAARQASLLSSISRGKKPCFLQNSPRPYADGQGCRSAACPPPLRAAPVESWTVTPPTPLPPAPKGQLSNGTETHTPPPPGRAGRRRGRTHLPLPARLCGCGGSAAAHPPCAAAAPRPPFSPQPGPAGFSEVPAETRRLLRGFGRFRRGHKAWRGGSRSPFSAKHNSLRIKRRVLMA